MDQALAALEELSSRVHDLFSDALKGPGVLSALRDFAAAVDWTEPLVLSVLASHAALLALTVATRKSQTAQLAVLILCFALVRGGERLNALAAAKWDELFPSSASSSSSSSSSTAHPRRKRTNYFDDESGVFWSALVSAPLLLVMATQLVLFLRESWLLMIDLKVAQLRAASAAARRQQSSSGGQGGKAATRPRREKKKKKSS